MSILKWFNKPKWQSPNEQVRMTAVQTSNDAELLGQLKNIVEQDSSEKVQIAALNRLTEYQHISHFAQHHPNKKVKIIAQKKLINWFASATDDTQSQVFNTIEDKTMIQAMAEQAKDREIRLAAIKKINQQGFLGDLLFKEQEASLQNQILEQITQESTIQRLLERTNKKQHNLRKQLEQRLGEKKQNSEEAAIHLCQQLETVVHGKNTQDIDLASINQQYQRLETELPDALKLRYAGAYEAARMILDPKHRDEFLQKQKLQRSLAQLNDIESKIKQDKLDSLQAIQTLIDDINTIDSSLLTPTDVERLQKREQQLLALREKVQQEQKIPETAIAVVEQIGKALNQPTATPQQLLQFKSKWQEATQKVQTSQAFKQLEEQFQQQCLKLAEKIEQSAVTRDQAAKQAIELVDKATQLIEEGQLSKAKVITNKIAEKKRLAGFSHPVIKRNKYQLDQVWNKLKELRNWQKWSNDKVRRDIIKSVAAMHGQGLHPDAVLKKLKDCNEQWYALEDMEKLPGDKYPSRNQNLWQEFRTVSKAVFEPTQPFFEKRSEQQQERIDQVKQLIEEMNACDLEATSERDLARMTRNGVKELKSLDQLPPKHRGKMAKKLRKAINRIDNKLNEFYQLAENKKLKLIEQVQALHELEDLSEAIEQAKALQQQWKSAGIVKQYTERKLWKKFRKANDALFNKRDQIKQEVNQAQQQQKQAINDFIQAQRKLLKKLKTSEEFNEFKSTSLKSWQELDNPKNLMQTDFNQLLQQADEQLVRIKNKVLVDDYKLKEKTDELYTQYEQGAIEKEALNESLAKIDSDVITAFKARYEAEYDEASLEQQLIAAEFLTGLDTPEAQMEQRMAYQVKILSERMSGEKTQQDFKQAQQCLDQWFLSPKNDPSFTKSNKKRINQVLKALKTLAFG